MAYVVTQGTRDIGIRLALGATPASVIALILRQGVLVAGIGVGLGVVAAVFATRLMEGLLFEIPRTDVTTYVTTAGGLLVVALLAVLVPAVRASRIDPLISLRHE